MDAKASELQGDASAVRCRGLVKHYADVHAVDGVDLEIRRGECFGLLGPNGAGKTTTVEILEGLTAQTSGDVELLGLRWNSGHDAELRERIGVQLQETQLAELLTVEETVRLFRSFYRRGRSVESAIALMSLGEKRHARVGNLSGGQKQRLALACALAGSPDVLFLDEPTTGLDPQARLAIWAVVEEFKQSGGTTILTTHYMEEAAKLCDRVAIIDHGKIIAEGTPLALIATLGAHRIVELELDGAIDDDVLATLPGVSGHHRKGVAHVLTVTELPVALPALLSALDRASTRLLTMTTHEPTLEDVFVQRTGRALRDE
ncbi:MAG TPA: ABC transporter ATP-binding protein [Nannocystaceae bacterium]|nr:ABC transporter ATP-binding protein [Nannocystaceae bacterium]